MTGNVTRRFADDLNDTSLGQDEISHSGLDYLGANSGGITPRNADAKHIHTQRPRCILPFHQIGRGPLTSAKSKKDGQAGELPLFTNAGAEVVDVTLHE